MLTDEQIRDRLVAIRSRMEEVKVILTDVNGDYDEIRADRYDKGIRTLYRSDDNLQDSWMSLSDAIMFAKQEIAVLGDRDE